MISCAARGMTRGNALQVMSLMSSTLYQEGVWLTDYLETQEAKELFRAFNEKADPNTEDGQEGLMAFLEKSQYSR